MEEKNELNDIILNKGNNSGGSKKVLLAVATLAIVLIIVVVIMNRLSSDTSSLPQPVMPPQPSQSSPIPGMNAEADIPKEDPLFVPVPVIQDEPTQNDNIEKIAQKLKAESQTEQQDPDVTVVEEPTPAPEPVKTVETPKPAPVVKAPTVQSTKSVVSGSYYVQVGSFSKYQPNEKFLSTIKQNGYTYTFHKEKGINKVLVGPFKDEATARQELKKIRKTIKSDAFLKKV